ncbi:MAG: hypothetical protein HFE66_01950 [Clostridiales bacterium]|jgi:hypothetical protein|nr:hypothetical protein [Clostridiales bacterium]MCI8610667.1 hypothetical protein [Clostridiales bacterium]
MNRIKIRIDTMSDVSKLVAVATKAKGRVILTDNTDFKVSGKSLLGAIYTMEWSEVYLESDEDLYNALSDLVV